MIRRHLLLAGLLAGCARPLPPQSPPGLRPDGSRYTPRAFPPPTLSGVQAPAPALPGGIPPPGDSPPAGRPGGRDPPAHRDTRENIRDPLPADARAT